MSAASNGTSGALRLIGGGAAAPVQLFLLPYAGGGASIFWPWAAHLTPAVQAFALQPPGREDRFHEAPIQELAPLVDALAADVLAVLDRPYVVFGHSLGALLAWELVRALRERGAPSPAHLFVSGSRPPHLLQPVRADERLSDEQFIGELEELNGTPPAVLANKELMELLLPMLRADFDLVDNYGYTGGAPLDCPVTALTGVNDERVNESVHRWGELVSRHFQVASFPGSHFYMHDQRRALAELINRAAAACIA
jgi:medium-chain acyl-[acyl-carrier-protein] hydrolase